MGQPNGATPVVLHFVSRQDLYRDPATVGVIGANVQAIHQPSGLIYGLLLAHMVNLLIMAADQKRERPPLPSRVMRKASSSRKSGPNIH